GPTTQEAGSEPVVVLAGTTTPLVEFTQEAYEQALAENKKIFLMWYATWCPHCRAEQKIGQPYLVSLNESDLIGFRVNFKDKETSVDEENLAREFGVSTQSTRIYIVDGQQVFKTPQHYLTIKDYQDNFQKYFGVTP
ncbi:MAG: thioredoxin family protein, partial [Nanoarchaeota archaeon]|nr:thioredoxin family protein [Nanoarchaeota archaeon]